MHASSSPHSDQFGALLSLLPSGLDLDQLAVEHKAIERCREIADGATVLRLALARGPGGLSLRDTAAWASSMGIAEISNPGVKYRLDKAVEFLKAIMEQLLAVRSASQTLFWPGRHLRLADGTCISKPGSRGTDWRVHGVFELGGGGFSHLELTDGKGAESMSRGAPVAGEVRIADRYYSRAAPLHRFRQDSAQGADFIVRVRWSGFRLTEPAGKAFDLIEHLSALPQTPAVHEVEVHASVKDDTTLPLRLIILRKSAAATEVTRKKLLAEASRKQKQLDPRSLIAAEFLILATSLPQAGFLAEDVLAAYRLRWQIELAFKRLKSLLHIDRMPTHTARASRSWLYAHLILALVCEELSQDVLESFP
jgi:hypothetical protein